MTTVTGPSRTPGGGGVADLGFPSRVEFLATAVLAALIGAFGLFDLHEQFGQVHTYWAPDADNGTLRFLVALHAAPILWCRRRPVAAFGVVLAGSGAAFMAAQPLAISSVWPWSVSSQLAVTAALAVCGFRAGRRATAGMAGAYLALTLIIQAVVPGAGSVLGLALVAGEMIVVVCALELLRDQRDTRLALVEQAELTEAERTRRTLLEDRARIGRELHDVVAHHMSLIAVQAETAPYRIPGQAARTEEEFRSISAASREALADMRKILGLLRAESAAAETAPQPGLADVPALVEEAGAVLGVSGELADVSPLVGMTAYRVIQESLSNARRHAQGTEVVVHVIRIDAALHIEVTNGPADSAAGSGEGHGITGMRERVALVHGTFEAGPTPDGGFTVTATLPLEP